MTSPIVLVTGTASGIGAALCRRLAKPGARILMHTGGSAKDKIASFEMLVDELSARGATIEPVLSDLSQPEAGTRLVTRVLDVFGGLDHIVSNAGFALSKSIGEATRADLDRSHNVITGAFFDLITAGGEALKASHSGRVVAISSFVCHKFREDSLFPVTASAKAAVEALAKTLAVQLGPHGVTVNCVSPGYTRKDASGHRAIPAERLKELGASAPTRRVAEPDEVAALVEFLLSKQAGQINGQIIGVDGGLCIS